MNSQARIPQDYIERLLHHAAPLLPQLMESVSGHKLQKAGKEYKMSCVFHEEKTPSLHINPHKGTYNCFGCSTGGNAIKFLSEYLNLPFPHAVKELARRTGYEMPPQQNTETSAEEDQSRKAIFLINYHANSFFMKHLHSDNKAKEYAAKRLITHQDMQDFALGYAPDNWQALTSTLNNFSKKDLLKSGLVSTKEGKNHCWDTYRHRLIFPIRSMNGKAIAFAGRDMGNTKGAKYINSPDTPFFKKDQNLYGLYESTQKRSPEPRVYNIVEGYIDVISCHRHGFTNTVCSMGTAVTDTQLRKIYQHADHVRFIMDGDKAGQNAAYRAAKSSLPFLGEGKTASVIVLPPNLDPDELLSSLPPVEAQAQFTELLAEEQQATDFIVDTLVATAQDASIETKTKISNEIGALIEITPEPAKQLFKKTLDDRIDLLDESVRAAQAQDHLDHLSVEISDVIKQVDTHVIRTCGLLLNQPEWRHLANLDLYTGGNASTKNVIELTNHLVHRQLQPETKKVKYSTDIEHLVSYMKSVSPTKLEEQTQLVANFQSHFATQVNQLETKNHEPNQ